MDKPNIFREDTDFNICKSWLCGSTDGQTYSISDWFGKKIIPCPETISRITYENILDNCFCTQEWEDSIGWKHDYAVNDPEVDEVASKMVDDLNRYIGGLNEKIRNAAVFPSDNERYGILNLTYGEVRKIMDSIGNLINEYRAQESQKRIGGELAMSIGREVCKMLGVSV